MELQALDPSSVVANKARPESHAVRISTPGRDAFPRQPDTAAIPAMAMGPQAGAAQDLLDQVREGEASRLGDLAVETLWSEVGQGVHLEDDLVAPIIDDEVHAGCPFAAERLVGHHPQAEHGPVAFGREARREVQLGAAGGVLGAKVVDRRSPHDLDRAERLAVQDRDRDLLALDVALDQHLIVEAEALLDRQLELQLVARQAHPERRALTHRLDHHRVAERPVHGHRLESGALTSAGRTVEQVARGRGEVVQAKDLLGLGLVHGEARREHARAGVRDAEELEKSLRAAVLPVASAEGQEGDVDLLLPEHQVHVAVHEDGARVVAALGERPQHGLPRALRDIARGRQAAVEHTDLSVDHHQHR